MVGKITCRICGDKFSTEEQDYIPFIEIKKENKNPFYICSNCIEAMHNEINTYMFDDNLKKAFGEDTPKKQMPLKKDIDYKLTSPAKIKEYLDDYIVGQDEAKKIISVAYYNHLKRISLNKENKNEIRKSNIIMVGPTGSGKTLLARKLAEIANVPFAVADATTFTKKGYVGEDVEAVLRTLFLNANKNKSLAEKGIIYIDECDKLSSKATDGTKAENTVGGESIQQALLKMIEGAEVEIGSFGENRIILDTSNILFICGGAFVGLDKVCKKNRSKTKTIGFAQQTIEEKTSEAKLETNDFISYGMIPELVGRLPVIVTLDQLTEEDLVKVMTEPKDSILKEYEKLFDMDNIKLDVKKDTIKHIAKQAIDKKVGARGLRGILEQSLSDVIFTLTGDKSIKKITITPKFIKSKKENDLIIERGVARG